MCSFRNDIIFAKIQYTTYYDWNNMARCIFDRKTATQELIPHVRNTLLVTFSELTSLFCLQNFNRRQGSCGLVWWESRGEDESRAVATKRRKQLLNSYSFYSSFIHYHHGLHTGGCRHQPRGSCNLAQKSRLMETAHSQNHQKTEKT